MRADRLIALLLLLQSRGRITAAEVAGELEVSLATARRDLEALSAAGIPVYALPGRGGGWQLLGGARTNLTGFSGHESRALFWLLGTAGLSTPETRVATMKLIRALPQSQRVEAERLATSIHYDHSAWGERPDEAVDGLEPLRDAIVHGRVVEASYTSRDGEQRLRRLRPLGLVAKAGVWYLIADDDAAERGPRTYRAQRLTEARITNDEFDPPREFDLAAYWRAHTEEIEQLRSGIAATLRVPRWVVPILQKQFGRYCTVLGRDAGPSGDGPDADLVEVRAHLVTGLAEQLAGWGSTIAVLSPPELRTELARIGAELVSHNDGDVGDRTTGGR